MNELWPAPVPLHLKAVSPTQVNALLDCKLRVAFRQDERFRTWQRPTPRSSLGIAAHKLTEDVLSGRCPAGNYNQRLGWLVRRWDELLQAQEQEMRRAWAPAVPPGSRDWPGYAIVKVRLTRQLARQPPIRTPDSTAPSLPDCRGSLRLPMLERRISDPVTGIYGTPDLVEKSRGRLRVVDLKSGLRQAGVTEGQRRQLLLYGHLVEYALGEAPDDLIITDVTGKESVVRFNSADISEAVDLAVNSRENWNTVIGSGGHPSNLATPSPDVCQNCPFRVVCLPYWEQCLDEWEMPATVSGTVGEIVANDNQVWISITQDLPSAVKGERIRIVGFSEANMAAGDHIVATDLDRLGPGAFRLRWWSRIRTCKPKERKLAIGLTRISSTLAENSE